MIRAGIYQRISDDREGEQLGVSRQEQDNRSLAETLGWEVVDTFTDNDISATRRKHRPEYRRMLQAIQEGHLDALVAYDNRRLHRHTIEQEEFIEIIERHGVRIATVKAGSDDLSTADGRMTYRIKGAVARNESEKMAERLRRKAAEKAAKGEPSGGGSRPFGYSSAKREQIIPHEAEIIREMVGKLLSGSSQTEVVRWANSKCPTAAGKRWTIGKLKKLLLSASLAGLREHRSLAEPVRAVWDPIITTEQHLRLRALLSKTRPYRPGARYLLTGGLAVCGLCGGPLEAQPRADYRSYRCSQNKGCGRVRIKADEFEDHVVFEALRWATSPDVIANRSAERQKVRTELHKIRASIDDLNLKEKRLTDLAVDGVISTAEFRRKLTELRAERKELRTRLGRVESAEDQVIEADEPHARWLTLTLNQQREVIRSLLVGVVVNPGVRGRNTFDPSRVKIHVNFQPIVDIGYEAMETHTYEEMRDAYYEAVTE